MSSKIADHKPNDATGDISMSVTVPRTSSASASTSTAPKSTANLSSSCTKPRKRAKVSFSEEAISKDNSGGNGSKVVIKEEHGVFLGPLLGRMVVSSSNQNDGVDDGTNNNNKNPKDTASSSEGGPIISFGGPTTISFANDSHTNEKISYSESSHGILKRSTDYTAHTSLGDSSNVEYDNLVVKMGLLKIGHRYRVVVPVPDYWKQKGGATIFTTSPTKEDAFYAMHVRIAEESLDGDLRGEVQTESMNDDDDGVADSQHHICITLSARRRGPYRGRFVVELMTRCRQDLNELQSTSSLSEFVQKSGQATTQFKSDSTSSVGEVISNNESRVNSPTSNKTCLMSLQVDATIMGKDMGTPNLRNGVGCLGKMVGYDSDEETEWQGFD